MSLELATYFHSTGLGRMSLYDGGGRGGEEGVGDGVVFAIFSLLFGHLLV